MSTFTCVNCGGTHDTANVHTIPHIFTYVDEDENSSKFWIGWEIRGMCDVYATQYGRWDQASWIPLGAGNKPARGKGLSSEVGKRINQKRRKGYVTNGAYDTVTDPEAVLSYLGFMAGGRMNADADEVGVFDELASRVEMLATHVHTQGGMELGDYAAREALSDEIAEHLSVLGKMASTLIGLAPEAAAVAAAVAEATNPPVKDDEATQRQTDEREVALRADLNAWPDEDTRRCIKDGEHDSSMRHPLEECPTYGEQDEAFEEAKARAAEATLAIIEEAEANKTDCNKFVGTSAARCNRPDGHGGAHWRS